MNINTLLDKLEAKHPNWALDGLMRYISLLMILVYILNTTGYLPYSLLWLEGPAIMQGQIWRLFTFLIIPMSQNLFFLFFELMILVMCADGIEAAIGSFKLTMYYLMGAFFLIIASLIEPQAQFNSYYLYLTLFFGYATLYPDQTLYFMFIIPIKIKYLAWLSGLVELICFINAPIHGKIVIGLTVANYILFFGIPALNGIRYERKQRIRRENFEKAATPEAKTYRHKCAICGKTDVTNPELIFRYCTCSKCGPDGVAFCQEHLKEHKANLTGE